MQLERMQEAIRKERLDGWLFCNFRHRDALTDSILGLSETSVSTRAWYYAVPADGMPVKLVHPIEQGVLDDLPGRAVIYESREALAALLSGFSGKRFGVLSDPTLQILSTMDASSYRLFAECGIALESAARLIQRVRGLLDERGIASHERAAAVLYRIVEETWARACAAFKEKAELRERDLRDFMVARLTDAGLVTDHPPIVAAGSSSADPHYDIPEGTRGKLLRPGDVIQLDIWAKEPDGIYADISWVGYAGSSVPEEIWRGFTLLAQARDLVRERIGEAFADKRSVTGAELDACVRSFLLSRFPQSALRHRTGHGIDTECHGSGVNLDSVEFPDTRPILEGSCFSVEPGLYFADYGMRTEIDIYIRDGIPVISGGDIQRAILKVQDR